jgi:hypothetical protein
LNEVREAARIGVMAMAVKLAISVGLLISGLGLLSIPLATLASSVVQRYLARARCLSLLKGQPPADGVSVKEELRILWPNSWRLGVQFLSGYLTINANTAICEHAFGLAANAVYGLSVQLLSIAAGMANVWISTKWPLIGQYLARRERFLVQRTFWPRVWAQNATYLLLAGGVVFLGPHLLSGLGSNKAILPTGWMLALALGSFLDVQFTTWGTLISMENRLPYLWPTVATNVLSLVSSLALVHFTSLGVGALVLGPLITGSLFNYWYWPPYAARRMGTTLVRFLFLGPMQPASQTAGEQAVLK